MGQILHGSARTTEAVRRAIQHSQEGLKVLAARYGINEKTVAKWRKRDFVWSCPILTDIFFMESRKSRLAKAD